MSKTKNRGVSIEQMLHGYQDGHALIASSTDFSSESLDTIGILSDMSGPNMVKGFEEYITAYPLNDSSYYAISKTWYASEMPRPGSVWTHTLLIAFSDLPKIRTTFPLFELFKRPEIKSKGFKSQYRETLSVQLELLGDSSGSLGFQNILESETVLTALYENAEDSILLKSKNSIQFQDLIVSLWQQQWPRLRRQFSFCTGSIYPRKLNGKYFDLQICPENIESSFRVGKQPLIVIDPSEDLYRSSSKTLWAQTAIEDLVEPGALRTFLRLYGADAGTSRKTFVRLVNVFSGMIRGGMNSPQETIEILAFHFPDKNDASILKSDFLGYNEPNDKSLTSGLLAPHSEQDILFELSITLKESAFNYEQLDFVNRFLSLFARDKDAAVSLVNKLLENEINRWGERLLKVVAEELDEKQFEVFAHSSDRRLASVLASQNSSVIYSNSFWRTYANDHAEILSILSSLEQENQIDWAHLIDLLLNQGINIDSRIYDNRELDLTHFVLDWVDKNSDIHLNYSWQELLAKRPKSVYQWLKKVESPSDQSIKLIVSLLNPNEQAAVDTGSSMWIDLISNLYRERRHNSNLLISCFSLAIAFNKPDKLYLELVSKSFETVYHAIAHERLSYSSWHPIEVHTRPLAWHKNWDNCLKLIDALFYNFREVRWSKSMVAFLFYDVDLRDRVWHRYQKKFQ